MLSGFFAGEKLPGHAKQHTKDTEHHISLVVFSKSAMIKTLRMV